MSAWWFIGGVGLGTLVGVSVMAARRRIPGVADFLGPPLADGEIVLEGDVSEYAAAVILSDLHRWRGREVRLSLTTPGGCATSAALIARAVRDHGKVRCEVPSFAMSAGTLVALSARELALGESAALSPVDPISREGERVTNGSQDPELNAFEGRIRGMLAEILEGRVADLPRALATFMGEGRPHGWPLWRSDLRDLGLRLEDAR